MDGRKSIWQANDGSPFQAFLQLKGRRVVIQFPAGLTYDQCLVLWKNEQELATVSETETHAWEIVVKQQLAYQLEKKSGYCGVRYDNLPVELRKEGYRIANIQTVRHADGGDNAMVTHFILWEKLQ